MKVLHLISGGDSGGAKTHVLTLLKALSKDIDATVVCFTDGVFYKESLNTDIPTILIKQKHRNDLSAISKLKKLVRSNRYHVIHAHGARANFIASLLKIHIKTPMVTTIHSDYLLDFTQNFYKKVLFTSLNKLSLKQFDYYIGVSESFKKMLTNRGFNQNNIYTVYNAIDFSEDVTYLSKETFLKAHEINADGKTIIGIIGRFAKVKGHDIFLHAAAEVLKKNKDVIFLLAGEGEEKASLVSLSEKLGISENIKFLGFINDIYSFLNAIDINVITSHSESFTYALLEGAKMSKATVSTAVGGIPDLIKQGKTGLLAEAGDYNGIAGCLLDFIENKPLQQLLGGNLYKYASENFSTDDMKDKHIEIYKDILKREHETGNMFDVMMSGYYGFNNSGDDAILSAIIDRLRSQKPDIRIVVLSRTPKTTAEIHDVTSINRLNIFKIIKSMKRTRLLLNGGGSLIQDSTSTRSLIYYIMLMFLSKRCGQAMMMYANGIGPVSKAKNRLRAKKALDICDYITLREPDSLEELKKLGVKNPNIALSSDPVLAIQPIDGEDLDKILAKEGIDKTKKYAAISIRHWKNKDDDFILKITAIINELFAKHQLIPLFIPMHHPFDDNISKDVISGIKCEHVLLKNEYNVRELMGIISITKLTIGMRLHALIYTVTAGLPIIGLVYDPKVEAFMNYINMPLCIDASNIDTEKTVAMVDKIMRNYNELKDAVEREGERLKGLGGKDAEIVIDLL
ncbi:MAG: polysaccharide pyruvyl transferase CsaB [Defluviitaleaceae bacterium]|nr:polysaccharide pyruvyl transferase CsaB [Defluviitaleaceae bacterium]